MLAIRLVSIGRFRFSESQVFGVYGRDIDDIKVTGCSVDAIFADGFESPPN